MTTEPVRVKWTLSIGYVGAVRKGEFTIDREEWDGMTPNEREQYVEDSYEGAIVGYVDGNWNLVNADINDPVKED